MAAHNLAMDCFWVDKPKFDECEVQYFERLGSGIALLTPLADEIAKARQRLIKIRENLDDESKVSPEMELITDYLENTNLNPLKIDTSKIFTSPDKLIPMTEEQKGLLTYVDNRMGELSKMVRNVQEDIKKFNDRLVSMENMVKGSPKVCPKSQSTDDDNEDIDLFDSESGSDSEIEVALEMLKEERVRAYNAKKAKKPVLIAKSSIILDVKPWDDETDMKLLEGEVRKIVMDGLLWGASKLVPLAYGIHKLQINCVVEDDKVSIDLLQENIEGIEDYVQSVDIAAFNKI